MDYSTKQKELLTELTLPIHVSAQLALQALLKEICLSPKPGLVDRYNSGAHRDMNFATFIKSIHAITPWLDHFYLYGYRFNRDQFQDSSYFLTNIRPIGIACEKAMLVATDNINTHKGGIFALGLLLATVGYLTADPSTGKINYLQICDHVAKICQGIVTEELEKKSDATSSGEKLFKHYKLTGARGEAESGYQTVREIALPNYQEMLDQGYDEETSLLQAMLYLLAYNQDTNLVSRGGLNGLTFVQNSAKEIIKQGGVCNANGRAQIQALDTELIKRNLSPGGSADLIAITWFLAQYL